MAQVTYALNQTKAADTLKIVKHQKSRAGGGGIV
jgi:hypothetical protein